MSGEIRYPFSVIRYPLRALASPGPSAAPAAAAPVDALEGPATLGISERMTEDG
jgi:hypothetical protein